MNRILDVRGLRVDIASENVSVHAVRGLDLEVSRGETLCVVGESGSGKSVTALSILNLLPRQANLTAERMTFGDIDLLSLSKQRFAALRGSQIGMIFQDPMTSLNPAYTIGNQMMEVHQRHRRAGKAAARARAIELLERVGISNAQARLAQYPHQLSGGLRQRVMIAMALMCEPALIIADEPTSALDVTIQVQILKLLKTLQTDLGIAVILITHDLGVVARVADRVAVMYAGQIVETGPTNVVFGTPRHPYTAGLLRSIPVPGKGDRYTRLQAIPGTVPNLTSHIHGCAFASRCERRQADCTQNAVPLEGDSHAYRCFHPLQAIKEARHAVG
ncbi:ABC transporter ATP-binding protein [Mesorhizobium sp. 8]|uniref:ABC transporter ATP-binding protein n=1 Tax=Mesorhizobium sp. 8 TaxID=2584466 RepID=UPI00111D070D|nr:ABC transporter ATP-binding protein [Mesorhizobium sp. 8]QDB99471.1 ABC transporter ATP-binding protein [Mesorhizobium sp. 8]